VTIPARVAVTFCAEGGPELGISLRRKLEGPGQYADDRERNSAERNRLTGDVFSPAKAFLPGCVAQDHRPRGLELVFPRMEISAKNGSYPQRPEKTIAYLYGGHWFASRRVAQQIPRLVIGIERTEYLIEPFPVEIVLIRKIVAGKHRGALGDIDQPLGLGIGKRPDQRRIHKTKDRSACSDADRQNQNRGDREARALAQLP
jgi:hypothetical protein